MIAGNWKMNTTISEAVALVNEMKGGLESVTGVDKLICPPFVSLTTVAEIIKGSSVKLGAQNVFYEEKGAYTGEISPLMLAGLCEYVIIGHSERRQYFAETGEITNKKIKAAVKAKLKPILCVGENLKENESGKTEQVITDELKAGLAGIDSINSFVIAYEPIWAIGTGKAATAKQANDTISLIRRYLAGIYGNETGESVRILYGGSVNPDNVADYMRESDIDGALVGGASLRPAQFVSITKQSSEVKSGK